MASITGFGGAFVRANDPEALYKWYERHLGLMRSQGSFAFGIDRDTFVYQTVQHSIEVIHLQVDHRFLCRRKVFIILPEEGKDDLSALRRGRKRERSFGPH